MAIGILQSLDRFEARVKVFKKYLSGHIGERKYSIPFTDRPDWVDVETGIWMTEAVVFSIDDVVCDFISKNYDNAPNPDVWEPIYPYTKKRYRHGLDLHEELADKCNIWLMWIDASRTLIERMIIQAPVNAIYYGGTHMRDVTTLVGSGTLVQRSVVGGSVGKLEQRGEMDAANLITQIGKVVTESNNAAASLLYYGLAEQAAKNPPDKSSLTQIWNSLVAATPSLAKLSVEFAKLFLGGPDVPTPPSPTIGV